MKKKLLEFLKMEEKEETCRTCLSKAGRQCEMQSIFSECPKTEEGQEHPKTISEFLNLVVVGLPAIAVEDNMPKQICSECVEKLMFCFQFQQLCLLTDIKLRKCADVKSEVAHRRRKSGSKRIKKESAAEEEEEFLPYEENQQLLVDDEVYCEYEDDDGDKDWEEAIQEESLMDDSDDLNNAESYKLVIEVEENYQHEKPNSVRKTEKENVECMICKKHFATKKSFKQHVKRMHSHVFKEMKSNARDSDGKIPDLTNSSFSCDKCEKSFANKKYLQKHCIRHLKEASKKRLHQCEECNETFVTILLLSQHKASMHHHDNKSKRGSKPIDIKVDPNKPYMCNYCDKAFKQSWTLKDHLRVHTKETPFICAICGKAFNSKSNLQQHSFRHSGEKRYECPDCPKKFPTLSDLASHKRVHTKARPHVCSVCSAAFLKSFELKKHMMYHNNNKPHKCEQCDKRFVTSDHMRRHLRSHTGEKPYACNYCDRAFTQSNDLIKHLRLHLGENVYRCELCPQRFRLASTLRTHFAEHKNDDNETRERNRLALLEEESKLKRKLQVTINEDSTTTTFSL